jgi:putative peptide zinc metalloprotease protein
VQIAELTTSPADAAETCQAAASAQYPTLAAGVEALGEYQGSGYSEASYLVRRPDGQVVQLSPLLHLLLGAVDGRSTSADIAQRITVGLNRQVSAGNVEYLLANKFAPLGLIAGLEPDCEDRADAILTLKLRRTLLREGPVRVAGEVFRPLFFPPVVVVLVTALGVFDGWLFTVAPVGSGLAEVLKHPTLILALLALAVVSALFHEVGHASACCYGGAKPGVIGMGVYVMWPAFYTNVTDSYRLSRRGRIRTDLGGVYFNGVLALALAGVYLATGYAPLLWAILLIHLEMAEQLVPTFRFDGYFILSDLAGVPDLFATMIPVLKSLRPGRKGEPSIFNLKRRSRIIITSWVLMVLPLFALELGFFAATAPRLVAGLIRSTRLRVEDLVTQFGHLHIVPGLVSLISLLLLLLPIAGVGYVLQLTGKRLFKTVLAASRRRRWVGYTWSAAAIICATVLAFYWGAFGLVADVLSSHR